MADRIPGEFDDDNRDDFDEANSASDIDPLGSLGPESLGKDASNDLDDLFLDDELGVLDADMAEDLARYMADQWREREDGKLIKLDLTLGSALSKMPSKWLDAACVVNHVPMHAQKKGKVSALSSKLLDMRTLVDMVRNTPAHARAALRRVIESGGWIKLNALIKDFGDMVGDGWFWDEIPPVSSIGELRHRALLFVGKAVLGKTNKKAYKVAVVPKELREPLARILADPEVRAEEEEAILNRFASPDVILRDALEDARNHFAEVDWQTVVTLNDVESFLLDVYAEGYDALIVWQSLEVVLDFLDHQAHEIQALNDLASFHVSELVHEFVDQHYLPRWPLSMRRDLLETLLRFYQHLHRVGRVGDETLTEVTQAAEGMRKGKRKLNTIKRPPALGGETILMRYNPNTGQEERYTFNHQRLLMVWVSEFHQDWRHMLQVCKSVPDGMSKSELVSELTALDPSTQELLIARTDEDDFANAVIWFYKEHVLEVGAW